MLLLSPSSLPVSHPGMMLLSHHISPHSSPPHLGSCLLTIFTPPILVHLDFPFISSSLLFTPLPLPHLAYPPMQYPSMPLTLYHLSSSHFHHPTSPAHILAPPPTPPHPTSILFSPPSIHPPLPLQMTWERIEISRPRTWFR